MTKFERVTEGLINFPEPYLITRMGTSLYWRVARNCFRIRVFLNNGGSVEECHKVFMETLSWQ